MNRKLLAALAAAFAGYLLPAGAAAQNTGEEGLPWQQHFTPAADSGEAGVYSIAQNSQGILYFGKEGYVLEYDGVSWRKIPISERDAGVRLAIAADDTIYAGGYNELGRLIPDKSASLRFESLYQSVPPEEREIGEIRQIIPMQDAIYFKGLQQVGRWSKNGGMEIVWKTAGLLPAMFTHQSNLYLSDDQKGLLQLHGGTFVPAPSGAQFIGDRLVTYGMTDPQGRLFFLTRRDGFYLYDGAKAESFFSEVVFLLGEEEVNSHAILPDDVLALGTRLLGVILMKNSGELEANYDRAAGLIDDRVTSLLYNRRGELWLGLHRGIAQIQAPSPLSFFNDKNGIKGGVGQIIRHEGVLYASSAYGLMRLIPSEMGEMTYFEPVKGMERGCNHLLSTSQGLMVSSAGGIFLLKKQETEILTETPSTCLFRPRGDPRQIYYGERGGLSRLVLENGRWRDKGQLCHFKGSAGRIAQDAGGHLWLETGYESVVRINPGTTPPEVGQFDQRHGLSVHWIHLIEAEGEVLFSAKDGLYRFDPRTNAFIPDDTRGHIFVNGVKDLRRVIEDPDGNLWVSSGEGNGVLRKQTDGSYHWDPYILTLLGRRNIPYYYCEPNGVVWINLVESLVRFDPSVKKNYRADYPTLIRGITDIESGRVIYGGAKRPSAGNTVLDYEHNNLRFTFSAPTYTDPSRNEYQFFLEGFSSGWSDWTNEIQKDYTNLREGSYVFHVRSRNLYGHEGQTDTYAFILNPPLYRTAWAYGGYVVGAIAFIGGLIHWRSAKLKEQNRLLQEMVDDRTRQVHKQAEDLRAKNFQLAETNSELKRLNQEKNEFIGIASHDLKNPLGVINAASEFIAREYDSTERGEVIEYAQDINKSSRLMMDIITNLLDINRIEQGKLVVHQEPCNLALAAGEVTDNYTERAKAKNITISFAAENEESYIKGDASLLSQILDNLVSNAVKYTYPGKNVRVKVFQADGRCRFEVQDEGPGISEEDRKKLFQKFSRLSAQPTGGEHSTGLGLAIVKRMVEVMNGRVWCESEPGKGSAFIAEFPALKEDELDRMTS